MFRGLQTNVSWDSLLLDYHSIAFGHGFSIMGVACVGPKVRSSIFASSKTKINYSELFFM